MSDIDLKEVNEFQGNVFQGHCCFVYICTEWGDVSGFLNCNVQSQGRMKVISLWQIILYSNSEGQFEVFYVTSHKLVF